MKPPRRLPPIITDIDPDLGPLRTDWYGIDGKHTEAAPSRAPRQSKDAYIRQLEEEVARLRRELKVATSPRRTPNGGIQFPFGPTTGPLMRANSMRATGSF